MVCHFTKNTIIIAEFQSLHSSVVEIQQSLLYLWCIYENVLVIGTIDILPSSQYYHGVQANIFCKLQLSATIEYTEPMIYTNAESWNPDEECQIYVTCFTNLL